MTAPSHDCELRARPSRLVIVVVAFVIELADEREACAINQAPIDVGAKRIRIASREGVLPLTDLPGSGEEQLSAGRDGAREPADGRGLGVRASRNTSPHATTPSKRRPKCVIDSTSSQSTGRSGKRHLNCSTIRGDASMACTRQPASTSARVIGMPTPHATSRTSVPGASDDAHSRTCEAPTSEPTRPRPNMSARSS